MQTPERTSATRVGCEEVPGLLAERFGLEGFALEIDDRLVPVEGG